MRRNFVTQTLRSNLNLNGMICNRRIWKNEGTTHLILSQLLEQYEKQEQRRY